MLLPGGWLRTGDGGSFDADGYLYLHDRLADMIVTGGENVYPAEVESVLTGHPGIRQAAETGHPRQPELGRRPVAESGRSRRRDRVRSLHGAGAVLQCPVLSGQAHPCPVRAGL